MSGSDPKGTSGGLSACRIGSRGLKNKTRSREYVEVKVYRALLPQKTFLGLGSIGMIGRIWHGAVPVEKSDAYLEKMRTVALPGYRGIDGNRGAWVMHRIEGDIAHFDMLSFWDDVDAIKRFAGEDYRVSYYFDFDDDFLIEKEPHVRHWDMYED